MALVALAACRHEPAGEGDDDKPTAAAVTCRPAVATEIADTVEVTGVIAPPPRDDAIVSSPTAGRVALVAVEEGDHVDAGALLATIEDPALPAGSVEARAEVASAEAAKTAADQELARAERLVNAGIGARKDLDDARARAAAAAAALEAADARAALASSRMARRELRAPRTGTVLHVWRWVGESVDGTTATPVAEVADLSTLELHAQVPPTGLAPLRDGMTAQVRVLGVAAPIAATIVRVAPAVDPTTLLGLVRLQLASADGGVKVGSAATAQIAVATRPGLLVPASALRRSLVGADEVVVCDRGVARVRGVTVGARGERGVELKDGVKPGEQVVVDHVLGLEDGQPLVAAAGSAK
ncbi:MAG TPA: efflux RND transporter periplasmic adaptor subunit [Kofleriaceae bacterium]|nr:efflux RND transporter periplasmic adaptor subunit [Kofleriaceae bacterium]